MEKKKVTLRKLLDAVNEAIPINAQAVKRVAMLCGEHNLFPAMPYKDFLSFIFARTIQWGKVSELILRDHFIEGIKGAAVGVSASPRKIDRVLKYLEEKGLVKVIRFQRGQGVIGTAYYLNFARMLGYYSPKNLRLLPELTQQGVEKIRSMYEPYISIGIVAIDCSSSTEEVMTTMVEAFDAAKAKTVQAREKKVEKLKAKRSRGEEPKSITRAIDALMEMYGAPKIVWTMKMKGMARNYLELDLDGDLDRARAEMEDVISNWPAHRMKVLDLTRKRVFVPREASFEDFYRLRKEFRDGMRAEAKSTAEAPKLLGATKHGAHLDDVAFETAEERKKRIQREQERQLELDCEVD